jgi:hypothetical protein
MHVSLLLVYYLILARIITFLYPFNQYAKSFGSKFSETLYEDIQDPELLYWLKCCQRQLPKINRVMPWKSACLQQSIAAFWLLSKKKLSITLYFGMKRKGTKVEGHAWLRCGKYYIAGGDGQDFTLICSYAKFFLTAHPTVV